MAADATIAQVRDEEQTISHAAAESVERSEEKVSIAVRNQLATEKLLQRVKAVECSQALALAQAEATNAAQARYLEAASALASTEKVRANEATTQSGLLVVQNEMVHEKFVMAENRLAEVVSIAADAEMRLDIASEKLEQSEKTAALACDDASQERVHREQAEFSIQQEALVTKELMAALERDMREATQAVAVERGVAEALRIRLDTAENERASAVTMAEMAEARAAAVESAKADAEREAIADRRTELVAKGVFVSTELDARELHERLCASEINAPSADEVSVDAQRKLVISSVNELRPCLEMQLQPQRETDQRLRDAERTEEARVERLRATAQKEERSVSVRNEIWVRLSKTQARLESNKLLERDKVLKIARSAQEPAVNTDGSACGARQKSMQAEPATKQVENVGAEIDNCFDGMQRPSLHGALSVRTADGLQKTALHSRKTQVRTDGDDPLGIQHALRKLIWAVTTPKGREIVQSIALQHSAELA
eukprot:TRINITY_DN8739_c0_g1_i3.p1 TRINITY_DN8739_c0_g1~~TRINITY_DN8739_c0_g1_i3.p1  ORF type:complete len:549 (+),score=110.36 TRINITY_DN8739_c0_g1_i3:186-1649(+)